MLISTPELESDLEVKYQENAYHINKLCFCLYSKKLKNTSDLDQLTSIDITSNVEPQSLETFLDACQSKPYSITEQNVLDLQLLCQEWEVQTILTKVNEKLNIFDNPRFNINKLKMFLRMGSETDELETKIAADFDNYIIENDFNDIGIETLRKIVENKQLMIEDYHYYLNFTLKHIKEEGMEYTFLLDYLDVIKLTQDEIQNLIELDYDFKLKSKYILQFIARERGEVNRMTKEIPSVNQLKYAQETMIRISQNYDEFKTNLKSYNETRLQLQGERGILYEELRKLSKIEDYIQKTQDTLNKINALEGNIKEITDKINTLSCQIQGNQINTNLSIEPFVLRGGIFQKLSQHFRCNPFDVTMPYHVNVLYNKLTQAEAYQHYEFSQMFESFEDPNRFFFLHSGKNEKGQPNYFIIDFGEMRINLEGYSFTTQPETQSTIFPKSWAISGSVEPNPDEFHRIHLEPGTSSTNGALKSVVCSIPQAYRGFCFKSILFEVLDSYANFETPEVYGIITMSKFELYGHIYLSHTDNKLDEAGLNEIF